MLPLDRKPEILLEPTYGWRDPDGGPHRPTRREALREWLDAVDFIHHPERWLAAVTLAFHLATLACLLLWLGFFFSAATGLFFFAAAVLLVTTYNTVWLHRYCVHHAYDFQRPEWTRLFLWSNPLGFREESYVFAHHRHHERTDQAGDPYGPHLGWWGSYLAIESIQKFDPALSKRAYEACVRRIRHIGLDVNDHDTYRRTATIEQLPSLAARTAFAQAVWAVPIGLVGGAAHLLAWYGAIFLVMFAMRSFNAWGHGRRAKRPGREFMDPGNLATNNALYGVLASEWHNNHHRYPRSASYSFFPGQPDLAFVIIRALHLAGVVARYNDQSTLARADAAARAA